MPLNAALYTGSAVTVSTTEISLTGGSTVIQTKTDNVVVQVFIDTSNMASGDEFEIAFYEKVLSGGTQRKCILANLVGAQADGFFITGCFQVANGWDFSIVKKAGTDRAFTWSVRSAG